MLVWLLSIAAASAADLSVSSSWGLTATEDGTTPVYQLPSLRWQPGVAVYEVGSVLTLEPSLGVGTWIAIGGMAWKDAPISPYSSLGSLVVVERGWDGTSVHLGALTGFGIEWTPAPRCPALSIDARGHLLLFDARAEGQALVGPRWHIGRGCAS